MTDVFGDPLRTSAAVAANQIDRSSLAKFFDRPLIILSAPRSGSTLLFETLVRCSGFWSVGGESHGVFQAFPELHPAKRGYASGRLTERDATPAICHEMRSTFRLLIRNCDGLRYVEAPDGERLGRVRLLEKTPRNALNLRFIRRLFADAKYVILFRDPREAIASIAEAWEVGLQTGQFVTFPNLPGWDRQHWCLLLPPGWRTMNGKTLVEIAAFQWTSANQVLLDDMQTVPKSNWIAIDFRDLITEPGSTVRRILDFANVAPDPRLQAYLSRTLPPSSTTVSAGSPEKWRRYESEIEACAPLYGKLAARLAQLTQPA